MYCTNEPREWNLPSYEIVENTKVQRFSWKKSRLLFFPFNILYNLFSMSLWLHKRVKDSTCISRHHIMCLALYFASIKDFVYIVPEVVKKSKAIREKMTFKEQCVMWVNHILQRMAIKYAKQTFVFSENVQRQLKEAGIQRQTVIVDPGVDADKFRITKEQSRRILKLDDNDIYLLGLGRMIPAKGFQFAIEALKRIENINVKLLLVGDGPYSATLKTRAQQLGLEDRILFCGRTDRPELYFKACDLFLMTSLNEAFGQTILEAVFAGKPIIAFNKGHFGNTLVETASGEILGTTDGVYYCDPDSISLGNMIQRIIGQASFREIVDYSAIKAKYNWDTLALKLLS